MKNEMHTTSKLTFNLKLYKKNILVLLQLKTFNTVSINQSINTYARTPAVFARPNQNQIHIS